MQNSEAEGAPRGHGPPLKIQKRIAAISNHVSWRDIYALCVWYYSVYFYDLFSDLNHRSLPAAGSGLDGEVRFARCLRRSAGPVRLMQAAILPHAC